MYTMHGLELEIEARTLNTHQVLIRERAPLGRHWQGPSQYLDVRIGNPHDDILLRLGVIRNHRMPHHGPNLGSILQMGMKHHYLDADDKTGDVRASVDYVKGFTEGSDACLAFAEEKLVRFIKYMCDVDQQSLFIPPRDNPYRTRLKDLAEHTLKEWDDFKNRGFR